MVICARWGLPSNALALLDCKCPMKCHVISLGSSGALSVISCMNIEPPVLACPPLCLIGRILNKPSFQYYGTWNNTNAGAHLDVILTKMSLPCFVGFSDSFDRLCLADCNHSWLQKDKVRSCFSHKQLLTDEVDRQKAVHMTRHAMSMRW